MEKIILDSNIIIKYPKLLGLKLEDSTFIVTQQVLDELNFHSSKISLYENITYLIDRALMDGTVELINPFAMDVSVHDVYSRRGKLSPVDYSLLTAARYYLNQGKEAKIATIDREVIKLMKQLNIPILQDDEVQVMLQMEELLKQKTELNTAIQEYEKNQRGRILNQTFWGSGVATFAGTVIACINTPLGLKVVSILFSTIQIWGTCIIFLILGLLLYYWRERKRLSYGIFEFVVGFLGIVMVFSTNSFVPETIFTNPETDLKLVAGLYIMVRGQDNIVKSLKDTKVGIFLLQKLKVGN